MYSGSKLKLSDAIDINPTILGAKVHEPKALMVERELQKLFGRASIYVIPYIQYTDSQMSGIGPCLRVSDSQKPNAIFYEAAEEAVNRIYPMFYDGQEVYVSGEGLSIMPKGDALKYAVEHMLSLRYGHDNYTVEYDRHGWLPWRASILIEAVAFDPHPNETGVDRLVRFAETLSRGDPIGDVPEVKVPKEVANFVLNLSGHFRPDIAFSISKDTELWNARPDYAPGFAPDLALG